MRIHQLAVLIGATCLTASCNSSGGSSGASRGGFVRPPGQIRLGGGDVFVSPAGAVFRRAERGGPPIATWFTAADTDGNAMLDLAEFEADFERAFASFDTDADGEIEPDEVTIYETRILPEMASPGMFGGGAATPRGGRGGGGQPRGRGSGRSGGGGGRAAIMSGAARFGLLPISHPIMEADANFNRGVSRNEWIAAARQRFNLLDRERTGELRLEQLQRPRAGARPAGARPPRNRPE